MNVISSRMAGRSEWVLHSRGHRRPRRPEAGDAGDSGRDVLAADGTPAGRCLALRDLDLCSRSRPDWTWAMRLNSSADGGTSESRYPLCAERWEDPDEPDRPVSAAGETASLGGGGLPGRGLFVGVSAAFSASSFWRSILADAAHVAAPARENKQRTGLPRQRLTRSPPCR